MITLPAYPSSTARTRCARDPLPRDRGPGVTPRAPSTAARTARGRSRRRRCSSRALAASYQLAARGAAAAARGTPAATFAALAAARRCRCRCRCASSAIAILAGRCVVPPLLLRERCRRAAPAYSGGVAGRGRLSNSCQTEVAARSCACPDLVGHHERNAGADRPGAARCGRCGARRCRGPRERRS